MLLKHPDSGEFATFILGERRACKCKEADELERNDALQKANLDQHSFKLIWQPQVECAAGEFVRQK